MTDLEKSRMFWEKVIATTVVLMFIGMAIFLYSLTMKLMSWGIDVGPITGVLLQIIFMGFIAYLNNSFREELDRRLPSPRN